MMFVNRTCTSCSEIKICMMGYAVRQDKDLLIYVGCPSEMMHKRTCACNQKILATPLVSKSTITEEPVITIKEEEKESANNRKEDNVNPESRSVKRSREKRSSGGTNGK